MLLSVKAHNKLQQGSVTVLARDKLQRIPVSLQEQMQQICADIGEK